MNIPFPESALDHKNCQNLMSLKDDCLLHLLRYLELLELMDLQGVCCRLDNLIFRSRKRFGSINFEDISSGLKAKFMEVLQFLGPAVKSLNTEGFSKSYPNVEPSVIFEWIDTHCVYLETFINPSIDLHEITAIQKFSSLVKRLKSLTLRGQICDDSLADIFEDTSLEELEVCHNHDITESFFVHISNLKSLKISYCKKMSSNSLIEILKNNLTLKTLTVYVHSQTIEGNDILLNFITNNLKDIEELEIWSLCHNIYRLADLPNLKTLKIGHTSNERTDAMSQEINKLLEKLKQGNIMEKLYFVGFEGRINMDLLCKLTNLKVLFLNGGKALTNAEMKKLGNLPNLEQFIPWEIKKVSSILTLLKFSRKLEYLSVQSSDMDFEFLEKIIQILNEVKRPKLTLIVDHFYAGQNVDRYHRLLEDNKHVIDFGCVWSDFEGYGQDFSDDDDDYYEDYYDESDDYNEEQFSGSSD